MKTPCAMLLVSLVAAASWAQTGIPHQPESNIRRPDDPGMRMRPDTPIKRPTDPGMVVVPPKTDTEAIITPPKRVDPQIDDATQDIDKRNRDKALEMKAR